MKIKWIIILLVLLLPISSFATKRHVVVGSFDYKPAIFMNEHGVVDGFFVNLLKKIAEEENWELEFRHMTWAEGLDAMKNKELDLWTSTAYTKERDIFLDYTNEFILAVWVQVYSSYKTEIRDIFDIDKKRVAVMRKDYNALMFKKYLDALDIQVEYFEYDSYESMLTATQNFEVDACVANSTPGLYFAIDHKVRKTNIILNPFKIYFTVPEGLNKDILYTLDKYLIQWKEDDTSIYYQELETWLHRHANIERVVPIWLHYGGTVSLIIIIILIISVCIFRRVLKIRTKELEYSNNFLAETGKLAKVGGWSLQSNLKFVWNELMYDLYEVPYGTKMTIDSVKTYHHHEKDYPIVDEFIEKIFKGTIDRKMSLEIITGKNNRKWVNIMGSPVIENGKIKRIAGAVHDVSELKISQLKEERAAKQLQQAQKMEAIGTLAGGIAHDFNNILSAIVGYSELAKIDVERRPDKVPMYIDEIMKGSDRATKLVKQILTFSRVKDDEELKPFQVSIVIKEALELLRSSIPSTIELKQDINCNSLSLVNSTQIHQVVMNLCTNAYQAMAKEGGILSVKLEEIERSEKNGSIPELSLKSGKYIQLTVGDTGPGISSDIKEKIFEPYFTTKKHQKGTGLGLAVVHGIAQQHGGCINVYSEVGHGTIFNFYLPVCDENKIKIMPNEMEVQYTNGNETVMVIDDETTITKLTTNLLKRNGYTVYAFNDGIQALDRFRINPSKFDLIITDMTMPYMTGADLSKKMMEIRSNIPIILCTGHSELINRKSALEMGIKKYLTKPLSNDKLLRAIREVLDVLSKN